MSDYQKEQLSTHQSNGDSTIPPAKLTSGIPFAGRTTYYTVYSQYNNRQKQLKTIPGFDQGFKQELCNAGCTLNQVKQF